MTARPNPLLASVPVSYDFTERISGKPGFTECLRRCSPTPTCAVAGAFVTKQRSPAGRRATSFGTGVDQPLGGLLATCRCGSLVPVVV